MWLFAGLGNPGARYQGHRHNIGFRLVDALAAAFHAGPFRKKFDSEYAETTVAGGKIILLKPMEFMNCSGPGVAAAARFYKIPTEQVVVAHDDLDLAPGKVRVKQGGGNGGHNGLRSIDAHFGADYWRLRIGIGHPGDKDRVSPYVLSDFAAAEEKEWVAPVLLACVKHIPLLLAGQGNDFMSRVAMDVPAKKPDAAADNKESE